MVEAQEDVPRSERKQDSRTETAVKSRRIELLPEPGEIVEPALRAASRRSL